MLDSEKYRFVHPDSAYGNDPNLADKEGLKLVTFLPNEHDGWLIYRRKSWLEKLFGV